MTVTPAAARYSLWHHLRPYTDQRTALVAGLVTLASLVRSGRREVWIGDSHAAAYLLGPSWSLFCTGPRREVVLRAGARLMHSFAHKGFPSRVTWFATLVGRLGRRDSFVPIVCAGEIDVRNALPAHPDTDWGFVARYVDQVRALADRMKATTAYVIMPPPPCRRAELRADYPSVGTDEDRLAAFRRLRSELGTATADRTDVVLIDLTDELAGPDGRLRPELTDDGCHTNSAGHAIVRAALGAHPLFRTGPR